MRIRNRISGVPLEAKVSFAYLVCNIIQKSITFLTLPLFTRILTTTQYGQYSIYTSWSAIITIFVTLNLPQGTFGRAMVKYEGDRDGYISVAQTVCTILGLIFLALYFPLSSRLTKLFELPSAIICVMIAEMVFAASIQFWFGKNRYEYKYKNVVILTIIMALISPICGVLLVLYSDEKGYARIVGYAAVTITFGLVIYIRNYIKGKKVYQREYLHYIISLNIPLIVYYLSQAVFGQSDRLMINHYCGTDKAGIYGVAQQLALVLNFVLTSINGAYAPWMYQTIKEKKYKDNIRISVAISILMAVLLLGIIWMTPEIILVIGGEKYREAIGVVPPIAMSLLLLYYSQLFINLQFYLEKRNELIVGSIGAAFVNIVLNALLIPRVGYYAAGYTTLFAYYVFAFSNYFVVKKLCKADREIMTLFNVKILLVVLGVFTAIGFVGMTLYKFVFVRIAIIAVVIVMMIVNRKKIMFELQPALNNDK